MADLMNDASNTDGLVNCFKSLEAAKKKFTEKFSDGSVFHPRF
ncbi:hypothetical protein ACSBOB_16440 [Mesorhizobium sp. ASY16-5R]